MATDEDEDDEENEDPSPPPDSRKREWLIGPLILTNHLPSLLLGSLMLLTAFHIRYLATGRKPAALCTTYASSNLPNWTHSVRHTVRRDVPENPQPPQSYSSFPTSPTPNIQVMETSSSSFSSFHARLAILSTISIRTLNFICMLTSYNNTSRGHTRHSIFRVAQTNSHIFEREDIYIYILIHSSRDEHLIFLFTVW